MFSSFQKPALNLSINQSQPNQAFSTQPQNLYSQPMAQPQVQQQPQVTDYIRFLASSWDPSSQACQFKHYFYNLVHPSDVNYYKPQPNEDQILYDQAQLNNPDPSCMVPVLATGFEGLKERLTSHEGQLVIHQEKIKEIKVRLDKLGHQHQVETVIKIEEYKRRQRIIAHKVLQVSSIPNKSL